MILSLLWGDDDFQRTLSIVNTAGWDTDCNSGNIGCLMGIKVGLAGLSGTIDWRGPVADRLYLPTAEGGRAITDAVIEAGRIATAGRRMAGEEPVHPKGGARFHFDFEGAVQGFAAETDADGRSARCWRTSTAERVRAQEPAVRLRPSGVRRRPGSRRRRSSRRAPST